VSEQDQRQKVIKLLKPLDAMSVENVCCPGCPDVNYGGACPPLIQSKLFDEMNLITSHLEGWIELKWEKEWPAKGGPLRVPHYTQQQKVWARRRRYRGGACWLLLQVGADWILLDGLVAALSLGEVNREQLIDRAHAYWPQQPTREELIEALATPVRMSK
jgi:hypothetical protein